MKTRGHCKHNVWIDEGNLDGDRHVFMANNDDGYYIQQFSDSEELLAFVGQLLKAHDEAFGPDEQEDPSGLYIYRIADVEGLREENARLRLEVDDRDADLHRLRVLLAEEEKKSAALERRCGKLSYALRAENARLRPALEAAPEPMSNESISEWAVRYGKWWLGQRQAALGEEVLTPAGVEQPEPDRDLEESEGNAWLDDPGLY